MNDFIDPDVSEVTINKKSELPLVWLLPLIALLVSGWLIAKSYSEKGPVITISFPTAEGLEVDKTKIKYLNVEVGKVTAISISEDLKTIVATAQMSSTAAGYLKKNTSFWVERPQVGLGGISGLGTLLSGPYIAIKPGDGDKESHFVGLTSPPLLKHNAEGKYYTLETNNLSSMRPGTPINFHGIIVGEVLSHTLSDDANGIRLTVFINKPYDQFIRKNTRFWIDSGVDLSASADGFKVRTGPLISLLSGGLAFRTSPEDTVENIQPENSVFQLYDTYEQSNQIVYQNTLKYVMYFNGSVRGLTVGAPVQLRGIPIGRVTDINLELDKKTAEIHIPVTVELEPDRIKELNDDKSISNKDVMTRLINKGLRAQLQTGSLLTGQLLVDLDFHPKSKIVLSDNQSVYPEFPTTASSLDQFTHSANIIMDKVAKLPLEDLTVEANRTLQSLQGTSKAATGMLTTAQGTLDATGKTMTSAHQVLSILEPGSTTHYELDRLLQELTQAASSVKQLTDYLEQNPNSLIRGKKEEQ
ncbi:MAG: MlaD family protein [Methylobacter sp.]|jgi:paraquat-inducible protein B|uniref:PqiB family protein n=1 Tax=Methylobacter sp. TaxID=2051955 RepID=UPI0025D0E25C|nr:MlaD family protein [Methylobacter sp.]MCK9620474.1 MlaD family protein [Methylobacter sp.]